MTAFVFYQFPVNGYPGLENIGMKCLETFVTGFYFCLVIDLQSSSWSLTHCTVKYTRVRSSLGGRGGSTQWPILFFVIGAQHALRERPRTDCTRTKKFSSAHRSLKWHSTDASSYSGGHAHEDHCHEHGAEHNSKDPPKLNHHEVVFKCDD